MSVKEHLMGMNRPELHKIIKEMELHKKNKMYAALKGYSKMKKNELINKMEPMLVLNNGTLYKKGQGHSVSCCEECETAGGLFGSVKQAKAGSQIKPNLVQNFEQDEHHERKMVLKKHIDEADGKDLDEIEAGGFKRWLKKTGRGVKKAAKGVVKVAESVENAVMDVVVDDLVGKAIDVGCASAGGKKKQEECKRKGRKVAKMVAKTTQNMGAVQLGRLAANEAIKRS